MIQRFMHCEISSSPTNHFARIRLVLSPSIISWLYLRYICCSTLSILVFWLSLKMCWSWLIIQSSVKVSSISYFSIDFLRILIKSFWWRNPFPLHIVQLIIHFSEVIFDRLDKFISISYFQLQIQMDSSFCLHNSGTSPQNSWCWMITCLSEIFRIISWSVFTLNCFTSVFELISDILDLLDLLLFEIDELSIFSFSFENLLFLKIGEWFALDFIIFSGFPTNLYFKGFLNFLKFLTEGFIFQLLYLFPKYLDFPR